MNNILKLAIVDFKMIFRDSSLRSFFFIPILLYSLIFWVVPFLLAEYEILAAYSSLFLVVGIIEHTQMFSFIMSMVLIDEKETDVAKAYGVIPFHKWEYILSRFLLPIIITFFLNVVMIAVQPIFDIGFGANLLISFLTSLVVPVYVLSVNCIVKNRMEGMIYVKVFNILVLLPIAAFFIPDNYIHLFGIFPTHWIFQSIQQVTLGFFPYATLAIGLVLFIALILIVSRAFINKHFI